jgi:hypothetical protein
MFFCSFSPFAHCFIWLVLTMTFAAAARRLEKPKQNWIVDPWSDMVWIIGAPLLAFVWAVLTLRTFGAEIVWNIFIIFNVAHHFPTFLRIYGDKDCVKRFKWSLILGPIIPLSVALWWSYYVVSNGLPAQALLMLFVVLLIWDPWHFLMQHYGFMRIYDRNNAAPKKLAAWMDYGISLSWFAFIMIAAVEWLYDMLLYRMFNEHGFPLLLWIDPGLHRTVVAAVFVLAVAATLVYTGYLVWCCTRGFYVSPAKVSLLIITFGVMYLTYVPGSILRERIPEWTFLVGFATLGMVHVTQYLAIVWKFNRGLAGRGTERARPGVFTYLFSRGGLIALVIYIAVCLIYGSVFSNDSPVVGHVASLGVSPQWLTILSCLIVSVGFTSTFMHYYYDGFIWKFRHKENRENLVDETKSYKFEGQSSWWERRGGGSLWERFRDNSFTATCMRQTCYFGIPIGLMILTFIYISQTPRSAGHRQPSPERLHEVRLAFEQDPTGNEQLVRSTRTRIERQILAEKQMIALNPQQAAKHEVRLGYLIYFRAYCNLHFGQQPPSETALSTYRQEIEKSKALLEKYAPPEDSPDITPDEAKMIEHINSWKRELQLVK